VKIQAIVMAAAITLGSSCAFADPLQSNFGRVLPPARINGIVHSMGLVPVGQPIRDRAAKQSGCLPEFVATRAKPRRGRHLRTRSDDGPQAFPPEVGRAAGSAARVTLVPHPRARRTWPEVGPGQPPTSSDYGL